MASENASEASFTSVPTTRSYMMLDVVLIPLNNDLADAGDRARIAPWAARRRIRELAP